jgi:hypothetical protein
MYVQRVFYYDKPFMAILGRFFAVKLIFVINFIKFKIRIVVLQILTTIILDKTNFIVTKIAKYYMKSQVCKLT